VFLPRIRRAIRPGAAPPRRRCALATDKKFQKNAAAFVVFTKDVENFVVTLYKTSSFGFLNFSEPMKMGPVGIILLTGRKY